MNTNSYNSNSRNNYENNGVRSSNFVIPKIRYRHIEDQKEKNLNNSRENITYEEPRNTQQYRSRETEKLQE